MDAESAPAAPIVAELIAKNLAAKGGREALAAVRSAQVEGTLGDGLSRAPFVWRWKAPDKLRMEFTYQEMTGIQAYDGETGWKLLPFTGVPGPQEMSAAEARVFALQADFAGPLLDPEAKGYTVEYVGTADLGAVPTYELKLTRDGEETFVFLDRQTGLEIQSESSHGIAGRTLDTVTAIGDYRQVGDLLLAHSYEIHAQGRPGGRTLTFDSIELNPELPDSLFAMPADEDP